MGMMSVTDERSPTSSDTPWENTPFPQRNIPPSSPVHAPAADARRGRRWPFVPFVKTESRVFDTSRILKKQLSFTLLAVRPRAYQKPL